MQIYSRILIDTKTNAKLCKKRNFLYRNKVFKLRKFYVSRVIMNKNRILIALIIVSWMTYSRSLQNSLIHLWNLFPQWNYKSLGSLDNRKLEVTRRIFRISGQPNNLELISKGKVEKHKLEPNKNQLIKMFNWLMKERNKIRR